MKSCHGRKRCTVEAEEYVFGSPCPAGVYKYLNIVYTCGKYKKYKPVQAEKVKQTIPIHEVDAPVSKFISFYPTIAKFKHVLEGGHFESIVSKKENAGS